MSEQAKITPVKMILLGVGWFGVQFFWGFHSGSLPLFLRNFTESKFSISLVISLAGVAGFIVPPIVGFLSDRTVTRFGRRRPFILIGASGVLCCVLSLAHMPVFAAVAVVAAIMYLSLRIAETPYLSLLPDIAPPEQRSTASGVMNLFGSIGLISFFVLSTRIWEKNPNLVFYLVGIVHFGVILCAVSFLKEPSVPRSEPAESAGPLEYLKGIRDEANVLKFYLAQFFWWLGFWMVTSFATLFVVEELGETEGNSFLVLVVFSVVSTLFVLPLGILGDKFGRKGIISALVIVWSLSEFSIVFAQNLTHALILVGITAIPFAGIMGVGLAYFLDLIPRERTAEFMGISVLSIAIAQIFGPPIGGLLIDILGYRSIFPATALLMFIGFVIFQFVHPRPQTPGDGEP